jgi:hypothetical protein
VTVGACGVDWRLILGMALLVPLRCNVWVGIIFQIDHDVELGFGCRVFVFSVHEFE